MRNSRSLPPPEALRLIHLVRAARFANGRVCPHCRGTHVVLWGGFRGRSRYCCRSCRRTFSDLTATPYSYSKKPELWLAYQDGMRRCRKLRPAAADVGIHLATSFRWRHAILRAMPPSHSDASTGWTEVVTHALAFSEKGRRMGRGYAQRRGTGGRSLVASHVQLLLAHSRTGTISTGIISPSGIDGQRIRQLLQPSHNTTLLLWTTRSAPWRTALRDVHHIRIPHRDAPFGHHLQNVLELRRRLIVWLEQFKGVATKYLDHYLRWHRIVDVEIPGIWACRVAMQCAGGTPFS